MTGQAGSALEGSAKPAAVQRPRPEPRREAEPFVVNNDVSAKKYTPAFLASWREEHKETLEAPDELKSQRLEHYAPPQRPGKGKGKGKDKGEGGKGKGKGFKGKGKDEGFAFGGGKI